MIKTFHGIARWAKVWQPDEKYGHYSIDVELDDKSLEEFHKSRIQLKLKEDAEGKAYVGFKRRHIQVFKDGTSKIYGPPTVYFLDLQSGEFVQAKDDSVKIGNGSEVIVSVEVFKNDNGVGTRLERVFVKDLVEYDPSQPVEEPEQVKLPF